MSARRELLLTLALLGAGALLVLWGVGAGWATLPTERGQPFRVTPFVVSGSDLAPELRGTALVAVAAVPALVALRGRWRQSLGALIALLGLGSVVLALSWFGPGRVVSASTDHFGQNPSRCDGTCSVDATRLLESDVSWLPVGIVLAGSVLVLVAGVLIAVRGHRWRGMGASYDAPGATVAAAPVTDKAVWDALDRGDDPTA